MIKRISAALLVVLFINCISAYAATGVCQQHIKEFGNGASSKYDVGGVVFRMPFRNGRLLTPPQPYATPTISFYYSMDEHRIFGLRDRQRPSCPGWCNNFLVMISKSPRDNNATYRFQSIAALSEGQMVRDPYMQISFQILQDNRYTSYWKLLPERHAIVECGRSNAPSPECTIDFDYHRSVEVKIIFGKNHLSESSKLLDATTQILDCLTREQ